MAPRKKINSRFKGILLSGLPGSGKSTASRELSKLLGWPLFSIGDLFREKWKKDHPNGEVSFESYMLKASLKDHKAMDAAARKRFEKGNLVGDMHHGAAIAEGLPILRVFISAPLEVRAQRAVHTGRFKGKSLAHIKELLNGREQEILRVAKKIYGKDYDHRDTSRYHIAINSGLLTIKEKIAIVMTFFQ